MVRTKQTKRVANYSKAPRVQLYYGPGNFDHYNPPVTTLSANEFNRLVTTLSANEFNRLVHLAQLAIYHYNITQGTNYENVKVLSTKARMCATDRYIITFEANDTNAVEIFKTKVLISHPWSTREVEIKYVRLNSADDTFDDDEGW